LRAYLQGVEEPSPEAAAAAFEKAVQIDPGFGSAYLAWCWKLLARGDRDGTSAVIGRARSAWDRIGTIERAQLELQSAVLQDDPQARARALAQLARLTPADSAILRNLGDSEARARRFDLAVASYKAALEASPDEAALWNQLGYAQAYSGDLGAAAASLKRYQELDPMSANPLDSLGDAHFYAGAFSEAESYYLQAYEKNPAFAGGATLLKAAFAGLMRGDPKSAEKSFSRYLEALHAARNPLPELRLAQFEFLTGRRQQAVERMERITVQAADTSLRPVACCQLSVWALEEGELARAREWAGRAGAAAQSQAARELAALCRFLTEPGTPAQLAARAHAAFASSTSKLLERLALAYALVVYRHFTEAIPVLEELRGKVPMEAPEPLEVLLGWCLLETGRFPEADRHLRAQPVNQYVGELLFAPLVFPRVFLLRAAAATRAGRSAEAGRYSRLFALYSPGGTPSVGAGSQGPSGAGGSTL
jgi:tetratricopeptide (TPR) repeat protein